MEKQLSKSTLTSFEVKHVDKLVELELYKLVVDSVQDYAIFFMSAKGYIQTWNKGAQAAIGYTAADIIGKHFSTFYLQKDIDKKKPERELELASKYGRVEDEDWRVKKDGTRFWANVIVTALYDKENNLVGFAKITRDLSERKRNEDRLKKANQLLQRQHSELQSLNDSKDEFISLASHQLRTPATGVKQFIGMVTGGFAGDLNPTQQELLERAYESNERQLRIISDLLKVAQVDAGKIEPKKTPTNINDLLSSVIREQYDVYEERNQEINHIDPNKELVARIDSDLIRMVLENLVNNASKYSHLNSLVTVNVYEKGNSICIDIDDEGVGISREDMAKLFRKFSRIDNELSTHVGGNGLGLYWAKKVVDLHGGKITVNSKEGEGSVFTVELPK